MEICARCVVLAWIYRRGPARFVLSMARARYGIGLHLVDEPSGATHPHNPVLDMSKLTEGTFSNQDFTNVPTIDSDTCCDNCVLQTNPGKSSKPSTASGGTDGFIKFRASKPDWDVCRLKPKCCPKKLREPLCVL